MARDGASSSGKRRCFDEEFKRSAVQRLLASGKPVRAFAEEIGVEQSVLHRWTKRFQGAESAAVHDLDGEIRELKREIATIRESVRVLRGVMERSFSDRYGTLPGSAIPDDGPLKSVGA